MRAPILTPLLLACMLVSGTGVAEDVAAEAPDAPVDWREVLGLFIFGGPASSAMNVRLNEQTVAEVAPGDHGKTLEIAKVLVDGINVLEVEFAPGDAPPDERARLTVALATSQKGEDGKRRLDEAIAESSLPADPRSSSCTETFRFWAGPPPETELKKEYFVSVHGPPVGYLVTIVINDRPLYTTTMGERLFAVTPFIRKGKNTVSFEAVPSCFHEEITASGALTIVLAAGRFTTEGFEWEPPLLGELELEYRKNPQPFTRRKNFRAR